jgi:hypothetical protein
MPAGTVAVIAVMSILGIAFVVGVIVYCNKRKH